MFPAAWSSRAASRCRPEPPSRCAPAVCRRRVRGPGRSRAGRHLRRRVPPGSYHVVVQAADGAPLASTHETPLAVEAGRPVQLLLTAKPPPPVTAGRTGQPALRTLCRHDVERRGGFGGHARRRARSCQGDDRSRLGAVRRTLPHRERRSGAVTGLRRRSDADAMRNRTPPDDPKTGRPAGLRRSGDRQAEGARHPLDGRERLREPDACHPQLRHQLSNRRPSGGRKRLVRLQRHGARVQSSPRDDDAARRHGAGLCTACRLLARKIAAVLHLCAVLHAQSCGERPSLGCHQLRAFRGSEHRRVLHQQRVACRAGLCGRRS